MEELTKGLRDREPYLYDYAQRMLESVRMFILEAPEFAGFESCQHWTVVDVLLTREAPERLWTMVAETFPADNAIRTAAEMFKETAFSAPRRYTAIRSMATVLLMENAKRWRFQKR